MSVNNFKDLIVWQKAHILVLAVYKVTKQFPKDELFALVSQIRRAVVSVAANIVEGFRRKSIKDSLNFYRIADASLEEAKYHLLLSRDLGYLTAEQYSKLIGLAEDTGRLLTRWMQSQKPSHSSITT